MDVFPKSSVHYEEAFIFGGNVGRIDDRIPLHLPNPLIRLRRRQEAKPEQGERGVFKE